MVKFLKRGVKFEVEVRQKELDWEEGPCYPYFEMVIKVNGQTTTGTYSPVDGAIRFMQEMEISGIGKVGGVRVPEDVRGVIEEEILRVKEEAEKYVEKVRYEAKRSDWLPEKITFAWGGDTWKLHVFCDDELDTDVKKARWQLLREVFLEAPEDFIYDHAKKEKVKSGLYTRDGYVYHVKGDTIKRLYDMLIQKQVEQDRKRKVEREAKQKEWEEKKEKALKEANETGQEVVVGLIGVYDGDNWDEVKEFGTPEIRRNFGELGIVKVYLVATPEGKLIEKHVPSY